MNIFPVEYGRISPYRSLLPAWVGTRPKTPVSWCHKTAIAPRTLRLQPCDTASASSRTNSTPAHHDAKPTSQTHILAYNFTLLTDSQKAGSSTICRAACLLMMDQIMQRFPLPEHSESLRYPSSAGVEFAFLQSSGALSVRGNPSPRHGRW